MKVSAVITCSLEMVIPQMLGCSRSRMALAAFCIAAPGFSFPLVVQKPPDPNCDLPREAWDIPSDPYFTGIMIGAMHRPHGRIRKVTWYQGEGFVGDDDPPGWEKRVIQRFDDAGRCVETEAWAMGFRESRRIVDMGSSSESMHSTYWDFGQGSCTRTWKVRDTLGRQRAVIREPLNHLGMPENVPSPQVATEYDYDSSNRVQEAVHYGHDGSPERRHRWRYDHQGRVRDHRSEPCRRGPEYHEQFLYLPNGLVRTRIATVQGEPTSRRTDYQYDPAGRILSQSVTIDGAECWTMFCTYDFDGRLAIRQISDRQLDPARNRPSSTQVEETCAGIDRPLTREVRDSRGRVLGTGRWNYVDDERGNWTEKWSSGMTEDGGVDVLRRIEYAD